MFTSDFTDFTDVSLCLEPQKTQKDAKIIYDSCYCNLLFLRFSVISVVSLKNFVSSVLSVGNNNFCWQENIRSIRQIRCFYFKQQKTQIFTKDLDECFLRPFVFSVVQTLSAVNPQPPMAVSARHPTCRQMRLER